MPAEVGRQRGGPKADSLALAPNKPSHSSRRTSVANFFNLPSSKLSRQPSQRSSKPSHADSPHGRCAAACRRRVAHILGAAADQARLRHLSLARLPAQRPPRRAAARPAPRRRPRAVPVDDTRGRRSPARELQPGLPEVAGPFPWFRWKLRRRLTESSQAYFNAQGVPYRALASCNHASVGERLPFFVADPDAASPFGEQMVSVREFGAWAAEQKDSWPRALELHYDAYMSLLDNEIQRIWVYFIFSCRYSLAYRSCSNTTCTSRLTLTPSRCRRTSNRSLRL
jgi:hypothetical protein